MQLLSACGVRELMPCLIWFHWMRRCDVACVGAAGKLQGRGRRRFGRAWLDSREAAVGVRVRVRYFFLHEVDPGIEFG